MVYRASDFAGAFPAAGPVTYLHLTPAEAQELMLTPPPAERRWFHATYEHVARAASIEGLVPSCWAGGDSCCVFGYDRLVDIPVHRGGWLLEIHSRALPSQLKAWWVPAAAIRGVWRGGEWMSREVLRRETVATSNPAGCSCDLAELTSAQIAEWRQQEV